MKKSRYVRINEGEEVRRDHPIEYFLPMGPEVLFESQKR